MFKFDVTAAMVLVLVCELMAIVACLAFMHHQYQQNAAFVMFMTMGGNHIHMM